MRVTANVPAGTPPGVYTSALFVQERPPARQPKKGEQLIFFRFRYVVTIYVIVQPVSGKGEIADFQLIRDAKGDPGVSLVCQLKNTGTRHIRPMISWFLRLEPKKSSPRRTSRRQYCCLLATTKETLTIPMPLVAR